uniref:Uncharacterized protein n=1 Tax=Oryza barthii TaxID=65489 RepID=A0A0D3GHU4_9ORYZ
MPPPQAPPRAACVSTSKGSCRLPLSAGGGCPRRSPRPAAICGEEAPVQVNSKHPFGRRLGLSVGVLPRRRKPKRCRTCNTSFIEGLDNGFAPVQISPSLNTNCTSCK